MKSLNYVGLDQDTQAGLTYLGRIVRDAHLFGIIPENELCTGWSGARMQGLYEQVYAAWQPYAHLPSKLPLDLQEKHNKMYALAIIEARKQGWNAELGEDE